MGCGSGRASLTLAQKYTKSTFLITDISEKPLDIGRHLAKEKHIENTNFKFLDACNIPDEYIDKFDYIFMFDVLHDIPFASKALKELRRALKPGCYLTCMEMNAHTNVAKNVKLEHAPFLFGSSMFYCMPVSANVAGSEALGAVWGREKALEVCYEVGYSEVKDIGKETESEYHLLCKK